MTTRAALAHQSAARCPDSNHCCDPRVINQQCTAAALRVGRHYALCGEGRSAQLEKAAQVSPFTRLSTASHTAGVGSRNDGIAKPVQLWGSGEGLRKQAGRGGEREKSVHSVK